MKSPKISIITPSYNQGDFIEETIDSVLSQSYANLEYIIIDGGSRDNTVEIIKKYSNHLKYWVSEKDNGQSDAINKGMDHVSGDVVNWLNSDDLYTKDALSCVADHFWSNNTLDIVSGQEDVFDSDTNELLWQNPGVLRFDRIENTIIRGQIDQPSTFWRTEVFKTIAPLPEHYHYAMDTYLWVSYLLRYGQENVKNIDEKLIRFRYHKSSKTAQYQELFGKERLDILAQVANLTECPIEIQNELRLMSDRASTSILFDRHLYHSIDSSYLNNQLIKRFWPVFFFRHDFKVARKLIVKWLVKRPQEINIDIIKTLFLLTFVPSDHLVTRVPYDSIQYHNEQIRGVFDKLSPYKS